MYGDRRFNCRPLPWLGMNIEVSAGPARTLPHASLCLFLAHRLVSHRILCLRREWRRVSCFLFCVIALLLSQRHCVFSDSEVLLEQYGTNTEQRVLKERSLWNIFGRKINLNPMSVAEFFA